MRPLCFVLIPFGRKSDATGRSVDFDAVYSQLIVPAVTAADLEPLRAEEEKVGGRLDKPIFDRLALCEHAIVDITGANPVIYYELGMRDALRPASTLVPYAQGTFLPFDTSFLRALPYRLDANGRPIDPEQQVAEIAKRLARS